VLRSEIKSLARSFARVSTSGISDTDINSLVDQAQIFIARDINGIPKRSYVQIGAKFYIPTDMRFRMTIDGTGDTLVATDVQISATELSGSSGTTVAAALQTAIRTATVGVGTSVAWTNFYFTITTLLATSQTIEAPTGVAYSSGVSMLFGGADSIQTGTVWTGDFPTDCTVEADLPTDFHSILSVTWGPTPLESGPQEMFARPEATGTPVNYRITGDKIYFYTPPSTQDVCYIEYMSVPVSGISTDTTAPSLPTRYQMLLVYYTAYMMLLTTHEMDKASTYLSLYMREKNKMIINRTNQNTKFADNNVDRPIPYKVNP
jgi:hypothetical protein